MIALFGIGRDGRANAGRGAPTKMRSVSIGRLPAIRQFTSPVRRGALRVRPSLSRAFENRIKRHHHPFQRFTEGAQAPSKFFFRFCRFRLA
jgi:hypothetical protein